MPVSVRKRYATTCAQSSSDASAEAAVGVRRAPDRAQPARDLGTGQERPISGRYTTKDPKL